MTAFRGNDTPLVRDLMEKVSAAMSVLEITQEVMAANFNVERTQLWRWITGTATPLGEVTLQMKQWLDTQLNTKLRKPDRRRAYEQALAEIKKKSK